MRPRYCAFAGLVLAVACDSPAGPSGPTVAGFSIRGADAVLTGASTTYTLTANMSDGTVQALPAAWATADGRIGSVDGTGRFDARVHGATTITATHEGETTARTVQVVNDFGGTWTGRYVIDSCADTGVLVGGACSGIWRPGSEQSLTIVVAQTGPTFREVRAILRLDPSPFSGFLGPSLEQELRGQFTTDGMLMLTGSATLQTWNDAVTFEVEMFLALDDAGRATGQASQSLGMPGGASFQTYAIGPLTRTR